VKAFTPANKGDARGLEAADFWCWHWNKYQADRALQGRPMNHEQISELL
jgi:hypothetical protein